MDVWTLNGIEFTTVQEFAKGVGVTRATIYVWIAKGLPVLRSRNNVLLVPIEEALKWIKKYRS